MNTIFELELDKFKNVTTLILNSLYYVDHGNITHSLEYGVIEAAKQDIKKLIAASYINEEKVTELFKNKGWDQEKVYFFHNLLQEKKVELLYAKLNHHISSYGETVTNFDWLLKVVCGTSELKNLKYTLFQLLLSTVDSDGEKKKLVFDINKDMLQKLIVSLETIDEITN